MLHYLKSLSFLLVLCFSLSLQVSAQTQTAQDYFEQGVRLFGAQKFEDALRMFQQAARLEPAQPAVQHNIGMALLALGRDAEAVKPLREAVRLAPNEAAHRVLLCRSLSVTKSHGEAVAQCEAAVKLAPDSSEAHAALGIALQAAKNNDGAVRAADAALQRFGEDERLLNLGAETNAKAGNYVKAAELYETLTRLNPTAAIYQIKLAENYLRLERDAEAIAATRRAIELEKHPLAYFFLGKVYFDLGQTEDAAEAFRQSAALDPKFSAAFYSLGVSQSRGGKSAEAIAALRQAVALAPENFEFNKELGSELTRAARFEEALAPLKKAVALDPKDFEAKLALGTALLEAARYDEAMPILTEIERMRPGNPAVTMFSEVARGRRQGIAQIEAMKQYARENPRDLNVRLNLMQLLTYARRMPEAEQYIAEVLKMNPRDARVYNLIGVLRQTTNDLQGAVAMQKKSLEIEENPGAYANLAGLFARLGQFAEAMAAYEKLFALKPDAPNFLKLYADLLRDNGKRREALAVYKRSLALLPTNAPALFNAGVLSAKLGDLNAARQYLEMLKTVDPPSAKMLNRFLKIQR